MSRAMIGPTTNNTGSSVTLFAAARTLLGAQGVVDLALTCSYYTAVCLAQLVLKPEMEPGRVSTL